MAKIASIADAEHAVDMSCRYLAAQFEPITTAGVLLGWYRTTDLRGRHEVAVNKIRTRDEGDTNRYFTHAADAMHGPDRYWVVDRDSGRTVSRFTTGKDAAEWIRLTECAS